METAIQNHQLLIASFTALVGCIVVALNAVNHHLKEKALLLTKLVYWSEQVTLPIAISCSFIFILSVN